MFSNFTKKRFFFNKLIVNFGNITIDDASLILFD